MKLRLVLLLVLALAWMLPACASPASTSTTSSIEVMNPWVRAVGGMGGMGDSTSSALFMVIQNNADAADTLIKAESDVAQMVQIHLSEIDANGVSSMHEVDGVEIPAGGSVELKSGSFHIMLMGLTRDIKEGDTVTFILTFKNAGQITIETPVKAP
jgi:hypothetical protein